MPCLADPTAVAKAGHAESWNITPKLEYVDAQLVISALNVDRVPSLHDLQLGPGS